MPSLTTLPFEIQELIFNQLDKKALFSCVTVSRPFHRLFLPFLWQHIVVRTKRTLDQGIDGLRAHASLVTDLVLENQLPVDCYTIAFPRLKTLNISTSDPHHVALVRANPTVQDLTLKRSRYKRNDDFWEVIATEWICPRSLAIEYSVKESEHSNAFWRACSRFKTLSIINNDIPFSSLQSPQPPVDVFPLLERLTLKIKPTVYGGGAPMHVEWIQRCPRLVHLDWNLVGLWSPVERLVIELNNKTWPNLSSLRLERSTHSDKEFSSLVASLPHLKFFVLRKSAVGPLSFTALKTHSEFHKLHTFSVQGCYGFTGAMAQTMLENCPVLDSFAAPFISVQDVAHEDSQPWICAQTLRRLTLYVTCGTQSTIESRQKMFHQLGLLTRLILLDLGAQQLSLIPFGDQFKVEGTLSLKLSSDNGGLANFAGLTQLRQFSFKQTAQSLGMKEVQWILDYWKNLGRIDGEFTNTGISYSTLRGLFGQNGISFKGI